MALKYMALKYMALVQISIENFLQCQVITPTINKYKNTYIHLSNFEIERVFNELNNEDLSDNFIGVYSSDR